MKNKIYIGDNLDIMNSLNFAYYKNKVNFIYIDPPYNTNNTNFCFDDSNSVWKHDIEKRIAAAKNLLTEDGVIFISIDDNELTNLLEICYYIFGKKNYVGLFITKQSQRSNAKHINVIHEYIVCFAKNKKYLKKFYIERLKDPNESALINKIISLIKKEHKQNPLSAKKLLAEQINSYVLATGNTWIKNYNNIDENGRIFFAKDLSTPSQPREVKLPEIDLYLKPLKKRGWPSDKKILSLYNENRLCFKNGRPYVIEYLDESVNNITSILNFYSRQGTNDLKHLGLDGIFDTPKPVELIKYLIRLSLHENSIILDFYAGSGTTAQAVYEVNKEDKMNHSYILIQNNEQIKPSSRAFKILKTLSYASPTMMDVIELRINTYLKSINKSPDYEIIKK